MLNNALCGLATSYFATVNVPEMYRFLHPPSRPLRQTAAHAQLTLTCTGAPAESLPDAFPLTRTLD
jgi:hypothetical protein